MDDEADDTAQQSDPEPVQSDRIKPWTVKNVAPEARNAALAAAERAEQSIGEWISRAIRNQVQVEHQANRPLAVVAPPAMSPAADLDTIERLVTLTMQAGSLEPGTPPPAGVKRLIYGLLRDRLQDHRKARRTWGALGQTVNGASQTSTAAEQTVGDGQDD